MFHLKELKVKIVNNLLIKFDIICIGDFYNLEVKILIIIWRDIIHLM